MRSWVVGWYGEQLLPRVIDRMMAWDRFSVLRAEVARPLFGVVLEVGFGSGLNLPFYPQAVRQILALEPSTVAVGLARERIAAAPCPVEVIGLDGQRIPLADASVDAVLTTWTLCTIPDPILALGEFRRVLRPDGRYHFIEHGLAPDPRIGRWQTRLNPLHRRLAGGCHLDYPIDRLIAASGFRIEQLTRRTMPGPRVMTALYQGIGRPMPNGAG